MILMKLKIKIRKRLIVKENPDPVPVANMRGSVLHQIVKKALGEKRCYRKLYWLDTPVRHALFCLVDYHTSIDCINSRGAF